MHKIEHENKTHIYLKRHGAGPKKLSSSRRSRINVALSRFLPRKKSYCAEMLMYKHAYSNVIVCDILPG